MNYLKVNILCFSMSLLLGGHSFGKQLSDSLAFNKAIGIHIGTLGGGLSFAGKINKASNFVFKFGATYVGYGKLYNYNYNAKTVIRIAPDIRMGQSYLGVDYMPFKRKSFFVTGGISYFFDSKFAALTDSDTGFDTKDLVLSAEDFGKINFELKWNKLAPFLGLGLGKTISEKKRIAGNFELGSYYIGSPKILLDYTGVLDLTNIDEVIPQIENNMRGYSFLPYLKIQIYYNFK